MVAFLGGISTGFILFSLETGLRSAATPFVGNSTGIIILLVVAFGKITVFFFGNSTGAIMFMVIEGFGKNASLIVPDFGTGYER